MRRERGRSGHLLRSVRAEVHLAGLAVWRGLGRFYASNDPAFASSIAYFSLLSILPFFLFAFYILGTVAVDEQDRAAVLAFLLEYFPMQFEFLTAELDAIGRRRIELGIMGSIILLWAAMGVFGAITTAVNYAWGVEEQHSYLKHKIVSFVMLSAAGLLLLVVLMMVSMGNLAQAVWVAEVPAVGSAIELIRGLALRWATTVLLILVVGLVYYYAPNASVRLRDVWLGAVLAGLLWRVALSGFGWYVRDVSRFSVFHGSIAGIVIFLIWVYIAAVILLVGAEISAAHARLRLHRPAEIPAAPTPRT